MDYKSAVNFYRKPPPRRPRRRLRVLQRALARDPEFRVAELALRHAELEFARGTSQKPK